MQTGTQNTIPKGVQAPSEMTLAQAIAKFHLYLERRNFAIRTRIKHKANLLAFEGFLKAQGIETIDAIKPHHLGKWREHISQILRPKTGLPIKFPTQRNYIASTKCLFRFLVRENLLKTNPSIRLKIPTIPFRPELNAISRVEMEALLETFDTKTYHGFYDRTWAELAYCGGLRVGEISELELTDVDLENRLLRIRNTKGRQDRMAPLTKYAVAFLKFYIENVRDVFLGKNESEYLFPSARGRKQIIRHFIDRVFEATTLSDLNRKITFHAFRKGSATALLEAGADLRLISSYLGHRNIQSTQYYLTTQTDDLRAALIKYHPLENGAIRD